MKQPDLILSKKQIMQALTDYIQKNNMDKGAESADYSFTVTPLGEGDYDLVAKVILK